jgi:hypothetical protein
MEASAIKPMTLFAATTLAIFSFLFELLFRSIFVATPLYFETILGYIPIVLGCVCLWLCVEATRRAKQKWLVIGYMILLAPFAFSYPAWMLFVWVAFTYGGYRGPMP